MRIDNRLGDVVDRLLALLHALPQNLRRANALADVRLRLGGNGRIRQHGLVFPGDVYLRKVAPVHAHPPVSMRVAVGEHLRFHVLARFHALHVTMALRDELAAVRPRRERPAREGIELVQLLQKMRILVGRDIQRGAERRHAACNEVVEMVFKRRTHFVLPWRIVEDLHLREPAFPQVARAAPQRIKRADLREYAFDLLHGRRGHHHDVRNRSAEIAVVVYVFNEDVREVAVRGRDVGHPDLPHEILLERLRLDHRIEEMVAAGLDFLVARRALHVAKEIVAITVVCRIRPHHLRHFGVRAEIKRLFRDFAVGMVLRKFRRHLPLNPVRDVLDDGIRLHCVLELGAELQRRHLQHLQTLAHLRRQRLLLFKRLRKIESDARHRNHPVASARSSTLTGPSLRISTCMCAPKRPVPTRSAPSRARNCATTRS